MSHYPMVIVLFIAIEWVDQHTQQISNIRKLRDANIPSYQISNTQRYGMKDIALSNDTVMRQSERTTCVSVNIVNKPMSFV